MAESQYLVQALQGLQQQPQAPQSYGMNPQQLAAIAQKRQAFEAANPSQSYLMHNLGQAGQNLMDAPGNALSGLQRLAQRFGGQQPAAQAPYSTYS